MKKYVLLLLVLLSTGVYSQNLIFTSTGDIVKCNIIKCDVSDAGDSQLYYYKLPNYQTVRKILIIDLDSVNWDGVVFNQTYLMSESIRFFENRIDVEYSNLLKARNSKYDRYYNRGNNRIKAGGFFLILAGSTLATGLILSTQPNTNIELISGLMIVGSLNLSLAGAFIISGSHFNQKHSK